MTIGYGFQPTMTVLPASEDDRATPFELFFDLVHVFATTQITASLAREHTAHGMLQGLLRARRSGRGSPGRTRPHLCR